MPRFPDRRDTHELLESPPFVPATNIGVADALNMYSCIRVYLASSLNGFSLSWKYCAGPL